MRKVKSVDEKDSVNKWQTRFLKNRLYYHSCSRHKKIQLTETTR